MRSPSMFALGQLALVLLAALPFAFKRTEPVRMSTATAVTACGGVAMLLYLLRGYGETGALDVNSAALLPLAFLFVAGAAMGVRRPWFPAVHVLMALAMSDAVFVTLDWAFPTDYFVLPAAGRLRALMSAMGPSIAAVALGAISDPLSRYLLGRRRVPAAAGPEPA